MEVTPYLDWDRQLMDPTGQRSEKPRAFGKTMVIDKGLGIRAFQDLVETSGSHIDMIKIGFGTSSLYPKKVLQKKIEMAVFYEICIFPGGTFLEVAVSQDTLSNYFEMVKSLGFTGVEVSDGTIDIPRTLRTQLIRQAISEDLTVITEYGKKLWGSRINLPELMETITMDTKCGATLVTIEGRESGAGVGIYDENGKCRDEELELILKHIPNPQLILWEAPHKSQQIHLLKTLGPEVNLGNIPPEEIMSLESLRRGLRSDTFYFGEASKTD